jgi:branched-chain amino acid transport system substrate-binding protein
MQHMKRPVAIAAACIAGALAVPALAAASGPTPPPTAPAPLVIAVEGPQSGDQASNGRDQLRGVQLAVRQVNARGGVLGRPVRILRVDDRGEAARAVPVARRVIAAGVPFLIGPYNSSVGIRNLPLYRRNGVLPVWMTSRDDTRGAGVTVQPMNSQIAPIEAAHIRRSGASRVTMLVDDTANGAFTAGMADRLTARLAASGVQVTRISVEEIGDAPPGYYAQKVTEALATNPDMLYVSTYFPEGVQIAKALASSGDGPACLMGLANVDNGFTAATTLPEARRCVFSGVVAAGQMPSAASYARQYRAVFGREPGVWGSFTHDSARILFAAIERAGTTRSAAVQAQLRATRNFRGATGPITIARATGYRVNVPVNILTVNQRKQFVIAR